MNPVRGNSQRVAAQQAGYNETENAERPEQGTTQQLRANAAVDGDHRRREANRTPGAVMQVDANSQREAAQVVQDHVEFDEKRLVAYDRVYEKASKSIDTFFKLAEQKLNPPEQATPAELRFYKKLNKAIQTYNRAERVTLVATHLGTHARLTSRLVRSLQEAQRLLLAALPAQEGNPQPENP